MIKIIIVVLGIFVFALQILAIYFVAINLFNPVGEVKLYVIFLMLWIFYSLLIKK